MEPNEKEVTTALEIVKALMDKGLEKELAQNGYNWSDNEGEEAMAELGVRYNCGATKFVLTCEALENWVIKLSYDVNEEFAEETGITDFCGREADNYSLAIMKGLDECFASTWFAGIVEGYKVYLQERVDCNSEVFNDLFREYVEVNIASEDEDENDIEEKVYYLEDSHRVEAVFAGRLPFGKLTELIDFCEDQDINDLHECNYGVRPDGTYVIIDFSGYSD